ncbi:MAG: prolyl oligopeptidase family serine peptidase [Proteobacteria bacterium]|nr:prolyl oligopeptidase family serine peptidase [Pseudomonadota bacterium]
MKKINISAKDLYEIGFLGTISVKPDERRFIYTISRVDKKKDGYITDVIEFNLETKTEKRILKKGHKYGAVKYSPKGSMISFISDRDKKGKLYIMPSDGGEAEAIELEKYFIEDYVWSSGEKYILMTLIEKSKEEKQIEEEKEEDKKKSLPTVRIIDNLIYRFDGKGVLHKNRPQLYLYNIRTKQLKKMTNLKPGVLEGVLSPNGKYIYYTTFDKSNWEIDSNYISVYKMNVKSGKISRLEITDGPKYSLVISGDGKYLCFIGNTDVDDYTGTANIKPFVYDIKNGKYFRIMENRDLMCTDTTIDDMGEGFESASIKISPNNTLYFQVSDRGNTHLYKYDLDKNILHHVFNGEGKVMAFGACGKIEIFALSNTDHPGRVFIKKGEKKELVVDPNKEFISSRNIAISEKISWKGFENDRVYGWILKPHNFNETKKYPLIVEIHGGPHAQYGNSFFHEFQVLAAKGYVVFYSNTHGSTGYGEKFAKSLVKRWGEPDSVDIMKAVDILKKKPYIDPQRIGLTGGSYGGFMTNWMIGHTDIFKAAVTQRSISNLVSFFGSSDFGYQFRKEFGTTFWEDMSYYLEYSPISYVKNIKTPLLIIHSENDLRCPIEQAEQLYTALKILKKKVRFARFPGESHGLSRMGTPSRRLKRLELMTDWFKKYL